MRLRFCLLLFHMVYHILYGLPYNKSGYFAHCSYFLAPAGLGENTTQLAKYPHVLYAKRSNKVYVLEVTQNSQCESSLHCV